MRHCAFAPLCLLPDTAPCGAPCPHAVVYVLADPRDGDVFYVGSTRNAARRAAQHGRACRSIAWSVPLAGRVAALNSIGLRPAFVPVAVGGFDVERAVTRSFIAAGATVCNRTAAATESPTFTAGDAAAIMRCVASELPGILASAPWLLVSDARNRHAADDSHPFAAARAALGWTIARAADELGIRGPSLSRIELGRNFPSAQVMVRMLAFGVDAEDLLVWHAAHAAETTAELARASEMRASRALPSAAPEGVTP